MMRRSGVQHVHGDETHGLLVLGLVVLTFQHFVRIISLSLW